MSADQMARAARSLAETLDWGVIGDQFADAVIAATRADH